MFKLEIRYYGELCDKELQDNKEVFDSDTLGISKNRTDLLKIMEEKGIDYIQNGYVLDNGENKKDLTRYFFDYIENWNNYIELEIIDIEKIIQEKIDNFNNITLTNPIYNDEYVRQDFLKLIKDLEKEYNCEIDSISYEIKFL